MGHDLAYALYYVLLCYAYGHGFVEGKLTGVYTACISKLITVLMALTGMVTISPSEVASVCNGGQLEVTCTTTESFLRWNITLYQEAMTTGSDTFTRTVSSFGSTSEVSPLTINSSMFTFIRTSTEGHVPLMSTLLINPVTRMLNRTTVTCMQVSSPGSSTTVLHIIENVYNNCELFV